MNHPSAKGIQLVNKRICPDRDIKWVGKQKLDIIFWQRYLVKY